MKIKLCSLLVDDQAKALAFYTETLGFVKKADIDMGAARWLTVVSADEPDAAELVLEPTTNATGRTYQQALFEQGIPQVSFEVDDIEAEHARLEGQGVTFRFAPTAAGPVTLAVFEGTCGNLVQIYQQ